jgi:hypothetical protein
MPVDLARNAHARHGRRQSVALRAISNDTLPRRVADFASPQDYATAQAFEDLVFVTTKQMNHAFALAKVRQHYELHPGIHSSTYWNPWVRAQLAAQYARVRHWDGGGSPPPRPTRFDYRSTAKQFSVWGWRLAVHRLVPEFLTLSGVSCNGLTVHGDGIVTVRVPRQCGTGHRGSRLIRVDLGAAGGPSAPGDVDTSPGRTVHVRLGPL